MERLARLALIAALLAFPACGGDDAAVPASGPRAYVFAVRGLPESEGRFVAVTGDPAVLARLDAELALPEARRGLHVSGPIAPGDGGHNSPWSWHLTPNAWDLVEVSVELCDGVPADVEKDVGGWIANVGTFCPWGSYVQRRL